MDASLGVVIELINDETSPPTPKLYGQYKDRQARRAAKKKSKCLQRSDT